MNPDREFYLAISAGKQKGMRFHLGRSKITIGRNRNNLISLRDVEVSRVHAQILREGDGESFRLIDLDSSNGVFVNDQQVNEARLQDGDQIRFGRTTCLFERGTHVADESSLPNDDLYSVIAPIDPQNTPLENRLDVICEVSKTISQTEDLNELLPHVLKLIFSLTDADRASILLLDQETQRPNTAASLDRQGNANGDFNISRAILDHVRFHQQPVLINNIEKDSRWNKSNSILSAGVCETICVPIKFRHCLRGFVYVDNLFETDKSPSSRAFDQEHLKLMASIGQQVAVALEYHLKCSQLAESKSLAAVGESITSLSHNIKNILQGISGATHLVEAGIADDDLEMTRLGWEIVTRNQNKVNDLVLDMLSFTKTSNPDLRVVDLNALIERVLDEVHSDIQRARITMEWTPDPLLDMPILDPKLISRALRNIVRNAIEACADMTEGKIGIRCRYDENEPKIHICIEDNGCGIDDDSLTNIFSVFESSKSNRSTGIGLAIAQKIARDHDGEVTVESELGRGSKFCLVLPHFSNDATPTVMTPTVKRTSPSATRLK